MAVLVARADGNLTAAATWGTVDATALLESEAANTALTTSYVESQTFTPGAIEVDAIAVKVASRAASPSGTVSVRLAQAGALVAGTEVTINVSDIESRAGEQGWYLFKFAAPVTLIAATAYTLSAKTSVAAQVNLYRNATAANWSRLLRTTTTAAPAAGDEFHILGEWTAAATVTTRTVTMDSTATTDYGDGAAITTANPAGVTIGKGGVLSYGTTAATAYVLRLSTGMIVFQGGTLNIGTSVTQIPRDSTAVLEFDQISADGDFGLDVYGTFNSAGLSRTAGKDVDQCLLNTDEAVGQTVLGVDTDTGWLTGDEVAIAATARTVAQYELETLAGDASATEVTISAGLTFAHSGTSPTQAEVILLTRNVEVRSTSSTLMSYVHLDEASVVSCAWTGFRYLSSTTAGERGIEIETSTGSCSLTYCAMRDCDNHGVYITGTSANNVTISHLVMYNIGTTTAAHGVLVASVTTGTNCSFSDITVIRCGGHGIKFFSVPGTVSRVRLSSCGANGLTIDAADVTNGSLDAAIATVNSHTNTQYGVELLGSMGGQISSLTLWRNLQYGITVRQVCRTKLKTGTVFGNATGGILISTTTTPRSVQFQDLALAGDTSFAQAVGFQFPSNGTVPITDIVLENCTLGVASGIFVEHSNCDIDFGSTSETWVDVTLRNTLLASTSTIENQDRLLQGSAIRYQRVNQATGVHKTVYPGLGTVSLSTGTFRTAAPSESMAPDGATSGMRLRTSPKRVPVASGGTASIGVYVRKDSSYNGNAARLVLLSNAAVGIDSDLVLATHSAAVDTWQQLSGASTPVAEEDGVLEFVVECDGTAGTVFVDDWSAA